ncbi:MAG: hypothetical protein CYG61_01415 [Actinobacteria bacterium]|nr:MAG: hypothetical protein CYG61_01415 [Actinomycetota bacterium]
MRTGDAVGIDPAGAEVLARELQDAERMLIEAAAEVRAALADAGVTSFAAVELDAISTWCRAQAIDVRRRAGAIDVRGINARAAASLFAQDPEVNELRRQQLFVLLGLGAQELDLRSWVAAEFPELAERRERTISAMTALGRARATVGVQAYMGGSRDGNSGERMSQLMRLERAQEQQGRATAAEMERFLAGLDDAQVRYVATALLEALATERRRDRAVDMAEALAPLRSRLRDQLAEAARQAYMGRPGRQPFDVDALAKLYKGLGFERQRPTNAFTEFLAGLFFGDFAREDGAGSAGISRTLGHLASGLFAVGDVRDTLANVSAGHWRDAALSALGAIPIVGDLAKAEDAVDASRVAPEARRLWQLDRSRVARTVSHERFGKFYLNTGDGLWWSIDRAEHGGSVWKVFEATDRGLKWVADADRYGTYLRDKHKGRVGLLIPWKELSGR